MGRTRIARRELSSLRREKTIVLALLIQLFIAGFSSFLLVGLVSLYDPGSVPGGAITVGVAGEAGDDLADAIEGEGDWRVLAYESERAAREAFEEGRADAALLTAREESGVVSVEALVPDESVRSTVIVVQVREALSTYERVRREALASRLTRRPVPVPEAPGSTPTFGFTYTVLVPLLVFLPAFISGSVAADAITEEVDAGTLDLLRTAPLSAVEIVEGKMLAMVALAPAQAAAWLALLLLNGTTVAHPLAILALVTAVALVLVATGTGFALALGDRQSTQLLYSLTVLVVFGASTLLPESPPNAVAKFAVGSATATSYALLGAYALVAIAAHLAVRVVVPRTIEG